MLSKFLIIDKYICLWLCEEYNFVELIVLMYECKNKVFYI